jgi:N-carbamoylputrescine amidase
MTEAASDGGDSIHVAVIQTGPASDDVTANLAHAASLLQATDPATTLVLFPEIFSLPFWCVGLADRSYFDWAEGLDGPTLTAMSAEARRMDATIAVPFFERGSVGGEFYNSVAVLGPDGELVPGRLPDGTVVSTFRKHAVSSYHWDGHTNDEKFYFRPGAGLPVFDTALGPMGVLICYDRWYPEAWRVLALGGARIVLVPNASEGYVADMFIPLIRVSAAQNQVFAVAANRAGVERIGDASTNYYGRSCIAGPRGELLAEAGADPDTIIGAELHMDAVDEARQRLWVYRDRRPDLYGPLTDEPGSQ